MYLGITPQGGTDYFEFNSSTTNLTGNIRTALHAGGWTPSTAEYGHSLYTQRGLYGPVEETIKFQVFASGNDAGSRIHSRILYLTYILNRAKMAKNKPEINNPLLYYAISGFNPLGLSTVSTNHTVWASLVLDGKLILPQNYLDIIFQKKALDVEVKLTRDGAWFDYVAYNNFSLYNRVATKSISGGISDTAPNTFSTTINTFSGISRTPYSPFVNGIDTIVGPFPSQNNSYYMPAGYIVYHSGSDHGLAKTYDPSSTITFGSRDSSITNVTQGGYGFVRHNPTTTGWVNFVPDGGSNSTMDLTWSSFIIGPDVFNTQSDTFYDRSSHTHHVFGLFSTSGSAVFSVQPTIESAAREDAKFYGQETIITNLQYPEYVYMGVINTFSEDQTVQVNYRTRRLSGSGHLNVKEFQLFSTESINITKLDLPVTLSGINPIGPSLKPSGWLCAFHNYAGYVSSSGVQRNRNTYAANGPAVRFVTENWQVLEPVFNADFFYRNYTHNLKVMGTHGNPLELKSFFGGNNYSGASTATVSVTLLWTQGFDRNSWVFMYPSGIFQARMYIAATPLYPTIPRL